MWIPARLRTDHPHGAVLRNAHVLLVGNVAFDQLPDRRPLGALVDAGPARHRVGARRFDRLAALEMRHGADAASHRLADVDRVAETAATHHVAALPVIWVRGAQV